jgi:hypothetical protein
MEPDAFASQRGEAREFTAVGDRVVVEAHAWLTGASSGIELEVDFWSVWWVDDGGLVTRCEVFLEREPALDAAGLRP